MLRTLAEWQNRRPLWFVYGNNHWDDVIFREELESLKRHLDLHLMHVLAEPQDDWQSNDGKGESGFITPALLKKELPAETRKYECFLCGPKPMSDAAQQGLHALQVPLSQIHLELFDMV